MSWRAATLLQLIEKLAPELWVAAQIRAYEPVIGWSAAAGRAITWQATIPQYLYSHNWREIDRVRLVDPASKRAASVFVSASDVPTLYQAQGVSLAARASVALVDANPGSFFHDQVAGLLYVSMPDSTPPFAKFLYAGFQLYTWSGSVTPGAELVDPDGNTYFPYLVSVPSISKSVGSAFWGIIQQGSGQVVIAVASGALDDAFGRYLFDYGEVRVILGGDDLPWSECAKFEIGRTQSFAWNENACQLNVADAMNDLDVDIPRALFTAADATQRLTFYVGGDQGEAEVLKAPVDIEPAALSTRLRPSQPKPLAIGYNINVAPPPMALSKGEGMWCLAHHPNDAVLSVRCGAESVGASGVGVTFEWSITADASVLYVRALTPTDAQLAALAVTLGLASVPPLVVSAAQIAVTLRGLRGADGLMMRNFADIVRYLVNTAGGASASFDETILAQSRFFANCFRPRKYITSTVKLSAVLDEIMRSTLAYLYLTDAGAYAYRVWHPSLSGEAVLDEAAGDFLRYGAQKDAVRLYQSVLALYGYDPQRQDGGPAWERTEASRAESVAVALGRTVPWNVGETWLEDEPSAFVLCTRLARIAQTSGEKVTVESRLRPLLWDLLQPFTTEKARQPIATGRAMHLEVLKTTRSFQDFTVEVEADDQRLIGTQAFIAPDGSRAYGSMTDEERATMGVYTDDDGYPDSSRPQSWGTMRIY